MLIARITQNDYTTVMKPYFFLNRQNFKTNLLRTVAFLCATVALHYLFLESAGWKSWSTSKTELQPSPLSVRLHTPSPNVQAQAPVKAEVSPIQSSKRKTQSTKREILPAEPKETANQAQTTTTSATDEKQDAMPVEAVPDNAEASPANQTFVLRLPPSAELKMDVSYTKVNASPTHGVGSITWNTDGTSYSATIEVGVDLLLTTVNLLQMNSEGTINQLGLAPKINTDTRRNRAMTAIHFNHEEKSISFSSSNKTVPMEGGAQDAVSVLMQLAAIGNSDPSQMVAGKQIEIQVAEGRDAHTFSFQVLGEEQIESKLELESGKLTTIHLIRPPKPGTYNSTLEIWLAPTKNWYPVQIRNTESSGTVTMQNVVELKQKKQRPQ